MSWRVGVVDRDVATSEGREAKKAPSVLMLRGIPLKEMHFRPTSRMSSAFWTGVRCVCGFVVLARVKIWCMASGQFRVADTAVFVEGRGGEEGLVIGFFW